MPQDCQDRISRPVFFDRQNLTRDDLNAVIDFVRAKSRRHNRALVGHGVACGLTVAPVPGQPWHLQVGAGHAVLPSGEEVTVPEGVAALDICAAAQACLGIAEGCVAPHDLTAGPSPVSGGVAGAGQEETFRSLDFTRTGAGATFPNPTGQVWVAIAAIGPNGNPAPNIRARTIGALTGLAVAPVLVVELSADATVVELRLVHSGRRPIVTALSAAGVEQDRQAPTTVPGVAATLRLEGQAIRRILLSDPSSTAALLGITLPATARGEVYLALYASENPARFQPAMPDRCDPPGNDLLPTRICEEFRLAILCALPAALAAPDCDTVRRIICGPDHLLCPPDPDPADDCVILATIRCGDFGILSVDEFTQRRRLLPQWLLSKAEDCACELALPEPTPPPTSTPTPTPTLVPTFFTNLTLFTVQPTQLTIFTIEPSFFTRFTGITPTPSLFTRFSTFTFGPDGPGPIGPIDDVVLPVNEIEGIGPVLGTRLRDEGIGTIAEFLDRDTVELSRIMGVSEVRVADFQRRARERTGRGGPV